MKVQLLTFGLAGCVFLSTTPVMAEAASRMPSLHAPVPQEEGVGIQPLPLPRLDVRSSEQARGGKPLPGRAEAVGNDPISSLKLLEAPAKHGLAIPSQVPSWLLQRVVLPATPTIPEGDGDTVAQRSLPLASGPLPSSFTEQLRGTVYQAYVLRSYLSDTNGDGIVDGVADDTDRNGVPDTYYIDFDFSGDVDAIGYDDNENGVVELVRADTNNDGKNDYSAEDSEDSGVLDG
ncbi:MAG: hypothetical protein ACKO6N_27140 [Myxococcota bacterium]